MSKRQTSPMCLLVGTKDIHHDEYVEMANIVRNSVLQADILKQVYQQLKYSLYKYPKM